MENLTDEQLMKKVVNNIPDEACSRVHPMFVEKIKEMINGPFPVSFEYCPSYESDIFGKVPEMISISIGGLYNLETGERFMY